MNLGHTHDSKRLWQRICERLDLHMPDWKNRIEVFGQVAAVCRRNAGECWTDNQVFEALVRAILSNNTNWNIVEHALGQPGFPFAGYDMAAYAQATPQQIKNNYYAWFLDQHAGAMTLLRSLQLLARTAWTLQMFRQFSTFPAELYFLQAIADAGGNSKIAAMRLGTLNDKWKLPGFGPPLAAEALRNMGFDICKPDRHICRAAGAFGFVEFRNWRKREGTRSPAATPGEMLSVMEIFEAFARDVDQKTSFVDNAVWLICAQAPLGLHLTNEELRALVPDR